MRDRRRRSVAKSITWRVIATAITIIGAYILLDDIGIAFSFGIGVNIIKMAAYYGHQDVVTILLKYGANRCARDNKGNTALMGAMFKLEWAIVKQLRQVDCDSNANQTGQKTAAEFAKVIGQEEKFKSLFHVK